MPEYMVGIIFSIHPIGIVVASLILGKYMQNKGAKKAFLLWGNVV